MRNSEETAYVRNSREFVDWLLINGCPDVISFDHDLADEHYAVIGSYNASSTVETGEDCAKWCVENDFIPERVVIHSWNPDGAKRIQSVFVKAGHTNIVVKPFSPKFPLLWR